MVSSLPVCGIGIIAITQSGRNKERIYTVVRSDPETVIAEPSIF